MGHRKTAKALAMLVLANDELLGQIVELQDEVHDAHEQILNVKGQALESMELLEAKLNTAHGDYQRLQANLDAMQRDRDALAAEVRELRLVIKGQWGRIGELGGKVPPMDVPHAGPWMAAAEVVGKVVSEHGPCEDGEGLVRQVVARASWLSPERRAFVLRRLTAGEDKYGTPLRLGWSRAREALDEEMADGIAYAIAAGDSDGAKALASVWEGMPSLGGEQ